MAVNKAGYFRERGGIRALWVGMWLQATIGNLAGRFWQRFQFLKDTFLLKNMKNVKQEFNKNHFYIFLHFAQTVSKLTHHVPGGF